MRFHWYWPFARSEELEWAHGTARAGEQVVVQVIDRPGAPTASGAGGVVVVRDLPDVTRGVVGARWAASRALTYQARARTRRSLWRSTDFDLVHLHYVNRFTDAVAVMPRPLVMSVHDVLPHQPRLAQAVERRLMRRLCARPDLLVVHHQWMADRLIRDMGVDHRTIGIVPHQVFPVGTPPTPRPEGPPTVLMFGALRANKGLGVLGAALSLLEGEDLRAVVAGRGDPEIEEAARRLAERDPRVQLELGYASLDRKHELFTAATLVVLPYTAFESQSGVLHDAYGHGRPVVASDVGALGPTLRADGTGVVVEPADPGALAAGIRLALQPAVWEDLASATRRVARERTPQATGRTLRDLYDLVLT